MQAGHAVRYRAVWAGDVTEEDLKRFLRREGDPKDRDRAWCMEFHLAEQKYGAQARLPMLDADILVWLWVLTKRIVQKGDSVTVAIKLHGEEPTQLDPNDVITVEYTGKHTFYEFKAPWAGKIPRDTLCHEGVGSAGIHLCTTFYASLALVEEKESNESERVCTED